MVMVVGNDVNSDNGDGGGNGCFEWCWLPNQNVSINL